MAPRRTQAHAAAHKEKLAAIAEARRALRAVCEQTAKEVLDEASRSAKRAKKKAIGREEETAIAVTTIALGLQVELFWIKTEIGGQ